VLSVEQVLLLYCYVTRNTVSTNEVKGFVVSTIEENEEHNRQEPRDNKTKEGETIELKEYLQQ